jgi:hypothetical protein
LAQGGAAEETVHGSTDHDNLTVSTGGLKAINDSNSKEYVDRETRRVIVKKAPLRENSSSIISHLGTGKATDLVKRIRSTTKRNLENGSRGDRR